MRVYVVRNGKYYLGADGFLDHRLEFAAKLSKTDATNQVVRNSGRVAFRLLWKLVWFFQGERDINGPAISLPDSPLSHARFDSKEEALQERASYEYYGAEGPDDTCGWKAVPVLRRVRIKA